MKENIILILIILFFTFLIAFVPVGMQIKSHVNNGGFKTVKIKKFAYLFRAPNDNSVSKEGIAIPLFIIQVIGYVLSILTLILNVLVFSLIENSLKLLVILTLSIFSVEVIALIFCELILCRISKPKN